jgi:uncharacterized protein YjiS (DUF1127 family)
MYARAAKEELAILLPNTMSHYLQNDNGATPERKVVGTGLLARLRLALRRVAELPKRRAGIHELSKLSDHELAAIGLSRAEVPHVSDAAAGGRRAGLRTWTGWLSPV